ncbi:Uncharacterised protein [Klebsiella pneumoniae]|uniref:Uncharacterized protein n=1 Tax=Klebsiella pneumoniae TaxID=573 RepID=A0A2X3CAY7_KLEPN|nr:Uncharacterised protein [Klebsiella pneumoniae]
MFEVVHRRSDNNHIVAFQFGDQLVGKASASLLTRSQRRVARTQGANQFAIQNRDRIGGQVTHGDLIARVFFLPLFNKIVGKADQIVSTLPEYWISELILCSWVFPFFNVIDGSMPWCLLTLYSQSRHRDSAIYRILCSDFLNKARMTQMWYSKAILQKRFSRQSSAR